MLSGLFAAPLFIILLKKSVLAPLPLLFSDWLFHANRSLEPELCAWDVYIRDNYCTDITQSQDIKKTAKRKKKLLEEEHLEQTDYKHPTHMLYILQKIIKHK